MRSIVQLRSIYSCEVRAGVMTDVLECGHTLPALKVTHPWDGPASRRCPTCAREALGRVVREAWVQWAREQPDPKPGWLTPWETLDADQREVDMRIGEAVAAALEAVGPRRVRAEAVYARLSAALGDALGTREGEGDG